MDQDNKLRQVVERRRETEKKISLSAYQEASKGRLLKILEKKLNTSFIGAISQFENHFGQLWGHGKEEFECSEEELYWRDKWSVCRKSVLNNGNDQLRAVQAEMVLYTIVWNRYQTQLSAAHSGNQGG